MNIKFDFKGNVAVITGAATGIGRETAIEFAKAGANVAVCDYNEEQGRETVKEVMSHGVKSIFCKVDVKELSQIEAARDIILKEFGTVDFLISNAGVGPNGENIGSLEKIPDADWESIFQINLFGMVKVCRSFLKVFKEKKQGKIVLTSSIAAYNPSPLMPHYGASKIAIINLAQSLSMEMGPHNVNVNALCPGFVYTPIYADGGAENLKKLYKGAFKETDTAEQVMNKLASASAMRRPQQAIDMANGILFLCSDGAREITGQALIVDSGMIRR